MSSAKQPITIEAWEGGARVTTTFPARVGGRKVERPFSITVDDDGTFNVPATGDLHGDDEVVQFVDAVQTAMKLATGELQIYGVEIKKTIPRPAQFDPMLELGIPKT